MKLFTIGFTKKTAEDFFSKLQANGVSRVIDIRINNTSQLAGFAKSADLAYFLKVIAGIDYIHIVDLAPTKELLQDYRKKRIGWAEYEKRFNQLIKQRQIERLEKQPFENAALLCSEHEPDQCHRRLVAEYLRDHWGDLEIVHII